MKLHCFALLATALCNAALAGPATVPAAVVEGVQSPAWVERTGSGSIPLAPGMELRTGDQVRTGRNSRVLVKLSEGSLVKLGENGTMHIADIQSNLGGIFRAALNVAQGAFRFTTQALGKNHRRDVQITVATVTAGIRGTDLWGKADAADRQVVCLIEGKIEVGAQGESPVVMDQALQFYRRDQGVTQPVGLVQLEQLGQWALETDLTPASGVTRLGGKFRVTLAQSDSLNAALSVYDQVRAAGYAAQIFPAKAGAKRVYQIQILDVTDKAEAQALADQLRGKYGVTDPQISG